MMGFLTESGDGFPGTASRTRPNHHVARVRHMKCWIHDPSIHLQFHPVNDQSTMVIGTPAKANRQASLAGFLRPKTGSGEAGPSRLKTQLVKRSRSSSIEAILAPAASTVETEATLKDEVFQLEPPAKRLKRSPSPPYPPRDHPSYRPPPRPDFNHPFLIAPVPQTLKDTFAVNPIGTAIYKPLELDLLYFKRFIDPSCTRQLTKYLLEELPWQRVRYTVRGIQINTPRWTTVFGKDATEKPWTGYKSKPRAIPEVLLMLMKHGALDTGNSP